MQVAFYLAGEITQVKESIPGIRCASGNFYLQFLWSVWSVMNCLEFCILRSSFEHPLNKLTILIFWFCQFRSLCWEAFPSLSLRISFCECQLISLFAIDIFLILSIHFLTMTIFSFHQTFPTFPVCEYQPGRWSSLCLQFVNFFNFLWSFSFFILRRTVWQYCPTFWVCEYQPGRWSSCLVWFASAASHNHCSHRPSHAGSKNWDFWGKIEKLSNLRWNWK